jgi:hypothetical protein
MKYFERLTRLSLEPRTNSSRANESPCSATSPRNRNANPAVGSTQSSCSAGRRLPVRPNRMPSDGPTSQVASSRPTPDNVNSTASATSTKVTANTEAKAMRGMGY